MKKLIYLFIGLVAFVMISCSGSETYRGDWKVLDPDGNHYDLHFEEKSFTFTEEGGESEDHTYTQNSVSIKNSVETYGIKVDDGKEFQIHFPIPDDESKGAILDANGKVLYTIGRKDYVAYDELYDL